MNRYVLMVNSIFSGQVPRYIAIADDIEKLKKFVEDEQVETYQETIDGKVYFKSFRKGSVLENFNVPLAENYKLFPSRDDALRMEGDRYDKFVSRLTVVE